MKRPFYIIIALLFISSLNIHSVDNFNKDITAKGEVLILTGRVLDRDGNPVPGISVEIWQTDWKGIYDHPGDANRESRDMGFQFFGSSISNTDGQYSFRTVLPGRYEPRPRHIHVKVKDNSKTLFTTQIYFRNDGESGGVGGSNKNLIIDLTKMSNIFYGAFDLIIGVTDSQSEGPYYPVADVSTYDNDLAANP